MVPDFLDRYSRGDTFCHRLPATLKILLTLVAIFFAMFIPISQWPLQICLACGLFMAHSLARIPVAYLVKRCLLFLPLVLFMAISIPASRGFAAGWDMMATIVIRACLTFLAGLWLVNTTPFEQMLAALYRMGMPRLFAALLAFMYRYVFVLFDELSRMRTAQRARTFGPRGKWQEWKETTQLLGMLLIRAMNRAERIHGAMCARGWQGRIRTLD